MSSFIIRIAIIILFAVAQPSGTAAQKASQAPDRSWRKAVPEITWKNISPPFKKYRYFERVESFPFEPSAREYSPINAWWLAEAATLVYADPEFVRIGFRKAGLEHVVFFDKISTQCFVASNQKIAFVIFRGSEIWKKREKFDPAKVFADLLTDVDIRLVKWESGGKVQRGFKTALDEVWEELALRIEKLHRRGLKIWFGGHSLGAALATLAADRCPFTAGVYTIGSPRVGDRDFRNQYQVQAAYRIVNNSDIVTRVPPKNTTATWVKSDLSMTVDAFMTDWSKPKDKTPGLKTSRGTTMKPMNNSAAGCKAWFRMLSETMFPCFMRCTCGMI